MELIILGSSAAIPVRERNLPGIALKYKNELILFDCGEDIQRRIIEAGLKFNKPLKILITHFHGDHIIGLPGLLFRFSLIDRSAPLMIFGPPNLFLYLYLHRKILGLRANYPISIREIDVKNNRIIEYRGLESESPIKEEALENNTIFESKSYNLTFTRVEHSVLTYAYSFIENPRNGKFDPDKARKFGVPESRLWKKLQEGEVVNFDGKMIDPVKEGIVGPKRIGRKVTYSGDTGPSESLIELGKNSDLLIHEATFSKELSEVAKEKSHSTSIDAANAAVEMNAAQLILTHISSRYQEDAESLLTDAQKIFPNTILAKDLLRINLK